MKKIAEIKTDYICDENLQHIDVFFTDDDMEEGKTIAVVDLDTGKVIFHDNSYRLDEQVKQAIKEIKDSMEEKTLTQKSDELKLQAKEIVHEAVEKGAVKLATKEELENSDGDILNELPLVPRVDKYSSYDEFAVYEIFKQDGYTTIRCFGKGEVFGEVKDFGLDDLEDWGLFLLADMIKDL